MHWILWTESAVITLFETMLSMEDKGTDGEVLVEIIVVDLWDKIPIAMDEEDDNNICAHPNDLKCDAVQ